MLRGRELGRGDQDQRSVSVAEVNSRKRVSVMAAMTKASVSVAMPTI